MQKVLIKSFEMTTLGLARLYLGVEFEYFPSWIWLHQWAYIRKILNKYAMNNYMLAKILMDPGVQLQKKMGTWRVNLKMYISLTNSLIYMTNTWLDICFCDELCKIKTYEWAKRSPFVSCQTNSKILEKHTWLWTTSCMQGRWNLCCVCICGLGMWFKLKTFNLKNVTQTRKFYSALVK